MLEKIKLLLKNFDLDRVDLKRGGLNTLKGKVIVMAIIPIVAIIFLTVMILNVLGSNSRDYNLMTTIDEIKNIQSQNRVLNEEYYYTLNNDAWYKMNDNLALMREKAELLQKQAGLVMKSEVKSISEIIEGTSSDINQIIEKNTQRGFYNQEGLLQEFSKSNEEVQGALHSAQWDNNWVEDKMEPVGNFINDAVTVGETGYYVVHYKGKLPKQGKRDQLILRLGSVDLQYADELYINNIVFSNSTEQSKINIGELTPESLSATSGELSGYELTAFNGEESIKINANFNAVDNNWKEISVYVPIADIDITKYEEITYEFYTKGKVLYSLSLGAALQSKYGFTDIYYDLAGKVDTYNRAIARGDMNWESEESEAKTLINAILAGFNAINENIPLYNIDEGFSQYVSSLVLNKINVLESIRQVDEEILGLKVHKVGLEEQLNQDITEIRDEIQNGINNRKHVTQFLVLLITAILLVLIAAIVGFIIKSLNSSIKTFSETLDEMAQGNLTVRCEVTSKDEFRVFANSLNIFTEKLCTVLNDIQVLVNDVEQKNRRFVQLFKQITEGPKDGEKIVVEKGMIELEQVFDEIIHNVSVQNTNTSTALASLNSIVDKNGLLLNTMQITKESSDGALSKVQKGYESIKDLTSEVKNINTSVENANQEVDALIRNAKDIGDILVCIQNLSKQTDLLSLNAAIEASRAGESGKGFAVVAAEIKKLSEQTSKETQAIESLIKEINQKIDKVQLANKAVVNNVNNTLEITDQVATAITEVAASTQNSTEEINHLFTIIEEQNKSVLEIADVVEEISEESNEVQGQAELTTHITKQVANAMIDNLEEIEKLMKETTQLKQGIGFFKTEG